MIADPIRLGLPHRPPFVFIDEVLEIFPGEMAACRKTFPLDEPFFRGHFPGNPLVPGVILAEAMAQTAGLVVGEPGKEFRLSAIRSLKFLAAVRPDEEIRIIARKSGAVGALFQFEVSARVLDKTVAEGIIVLSES